MLLIGLKSALSNYEMEIPTPEKNAGLRVLSVFIEVKALASLGIIAPVVGYVTLIFNGALKSWWLDVLVSDYFRLGYILTISLCDRLVQETTV